MSEWKPIKSAPKDGAVLKLNHPNWERPINGYWDEGDGEWVAENLTYVLGPNLHCEDPTHWMPLPEPPKE